MNASVEKETDDGFGVTVIDNDGAKHKVGVLYDGDISGHLAEAYPDEPTKRTPEGNERLNQARRYARYHVYKERGYEAFPWDENIANIEAVHDAIEDLTPIEFKTYFGEFYDAVAGSLDLDGADGLDGLLSALQSQGGTPYIDVYLDEDGRVERTSEVRTIVANDGWEEKLESPAPGADRPPEARIEMTALPLPSIDLFQQVVLHQTTCQLRDYHIVMGAEPPEEYRVLGFGKYKFAAKYQDKRLNELYEADYTRLDADIPGYKLGLGLEDYPEIETQLKAFMSTLTEY